MVTSAVLVPKLFRVSDIAKRAGIERRRLILAAQRGQFPTLRIGRSLYVTETDVQKLFTPSAAT